MSTTGLIVNRSAPNLSARPSSRKVELDPAFCWQAVHSQDRRFDGRFFAGIDSTGVYCRSICPASFGHPANVRWFHSAAAAERTGFRPCRRCRPDTSPGSSAWFGTLAVVSHALKLIAQGALDDGNLEQLAERVGIGSRHLRRLFDRHLGASPLKIARSYRMQVAGILILETNVAVSEIALATGFKSIRQFNHSVRTTLGQSPTQLRQQSKDWQAIERKTGIVVHLPYRPPFEWSCLIGFLKARATPGVELVREDCYRRTIEIGGDVGAIDVWHEADHERLAMRVHLPSCEGLMQVVQRARRMFDLDADIIHIERHLSQDAKLAKMLAARSGLRVPGAWDGFELAVRAVLGQQLTAVDAPALSRRLVRTFGRPIRIPLQGLSYVFPGPELLAQANLLRVGIPANQAETICSLAQAVLAGKLNFNSGKGLLSTLSWLRSHPGLSQQAASYIAMRSFGDPNAFPHSDQGLVQAVAIDGNRISPGELLHMFEAFKPWRAYAAMHFTAAIQKTGEPISTRRRPRRWRQSCQKRAS